MATIKRSSKGIEMKPGTTSVRASEQANTTVDVDSDPDEPNTQSSARFREHCEVTKPASPEPTSITVEGIEWTPLDKDEDGFAHTYLAEGRAMKLTLNLRRERGEKYNAAQHEWILFRMGAVIARGFNLDQMFEDAALL